MSKTEALKARLREAIDACRPDGTYDDETFEQIHALIAELVPLTPTPRPLDAQDFVAAPWGSHFAQFGPRHTAGKPIRHESSMKLQSFNTFPDLPIKVLEIDQEIRVEGRHYNNVLSITTPDGEHPATLIVWGRYSIPEDQPQRYSVEFYAVELVAPEGVSAEDLRAHFGLEEGFELRRELKPPTLHSDVVYCDEDMRINFGSMGGVYVMSRKHSPGKSVSFA
ncbi:MAG: PAP/fibrillin family protein [Erythrobacter sp.]|nr:PAP/fibrillin family protein [Erythrobacter sp.]